MAAVGPLLGVAACAWLVAWWIHMVAVKVPVTLSKWAEFAKAARDRPAPVKRKKVIRWR